MLSRLAGSPPLPNHSRLKGPHMTNGSVSTADVYPDRLQDGIYFRSGQQPGQGQRPSPCYRLLLLNVSPGTTPSEARQAIATVWTMLQNLRRGIVRELRVPGWSELEFPVPHGYLTCLLGFGARFFDRRKHNPPLVLPENSAGLHELRPLDSSDAGPFPNLHWAVQENRSIAETDLAIQFIAQTELAVNRAAVEVWKIIDDDKQPLPLQIVTSYSGFNRDDHRSWLGFYDGISNIRSDERRAAIEVVSKSPPWMEGGTYMAFLRLAIDLAGWQRLLPEHQEILIGRNKLTGCPLTSVHHGPQGTLVPVPLVANRVAGTPPGSPAYIDPPRPSAALLQASHMHRANVYRRGLTDVDGSNRIFRQGYEFLEAFANGKPCLGLNFVSFQRWLSRLTNILNTLRWLGDVNFGGPEHPQVEEPHSISLLSVIAGGFYAVPPKGDPFPGADIF
jgi:Dyp-type peroxidase family